MKAIVAVEHAILIAIWNMTTTGELEAFARSVSVRLRTPGLAQMRPVIVPLSGRRTVPEKLPDLLDEGASFRPE
jgi:hypothetical protein